MVNSFKERLNAPRLTSRFYLPQHCSHSCHSIRHISPQNLALTAALPADASTTPPGSPPPNLLASLGPGSRPAAPSAPSASSAVPNIILDKLASIARQNASSAQSNPSLTAPAPAPMFGAYGGLPSSGAMQHAPPVAVQAQTSMPFLPQSQPPVNVPGLPFSFPQSAPPAQVMPPAAPPPQNGANNPAAATVQLVAALAAQGIPIDKIASVIQMMGQAGAVPPAAPPQMPQPTQTGYAAAPPVGGAGPGSAPWEPPRRDGARERAGYHDGMRSPNRPRGRSRSRSPPRWDGRGSPRSRANNDRSFDYGRPGSPDRGRQDDRDRRGPMPEYRQRSPRGRRGDSPAQEPSQPEKWIEHDNSIPSGSIKVYSRTLFVGGVT